MAVGRELWLAFFGMGILNNLIPFSLFLWGQQQIASGLASILNATTPIFAVLVVDYYLLRMEVDTERFLRHLLHLRKK